MDLREAASALGVHHQTAYAWVRQGVLPPARWAAATPSARVTSRRSRAAAASARNLPGPFTSVTRRRRRVSTRRSLKVRRSRLGNGSAGWRAG